MPALSVMAFGCQYSNERKSGFNQSPGCRLACTGAEKARVVEKPGTAAFKIPSALLAPKSPLSCRCINSNYISDSWRAYRAGTGIHLAIKRHKVACVFNYFKTGYLTGWYIGYQRVIPSKYRLTINHNQCWFPVK